LKYSKIKYKEEGVRMQKQKGGEGHQNTCAL